MEQEYNLRDIQAFVAQIYKGRRVDIKPFQYPVTITTIANGANGTFFQSINANSDFLLTNLLLQPNLAATAWVGVKLLMSDTASRQVYTDPGSDNLGVDVQNYLTNSNAETPRDLPYPLWLPAKTNLQFQLNNAAGGNISGVIVMNGLQLLPY